MDVPPPSQVGRNRLKFLDSGVRRNDGKLYRVDLFGASHGQAAMASRCLNGRRDF
jgi:hypothetical protein